MQSYHVVQKYDYYKNSDLIRLYKSSFVIEWIERKTVKNHFEIVLFIKSYLNKSVLLRGYENIISYEPRRKKTGFLHI